MSFAFNTPVQYLPGVGWRTAKVLHGLGVHTAGQLNRVPEKMLTELFGPSIRQVLRNFHVPPTLALEPVQEHAIVPEGVSENLSHSFQTSEAVTAESGRRPLAQRLRLAAQFVSMI